MGRMAIRISNPRRTRRLENCRYLSKDFTSLTCFIVLEFFNSCRVFSIVQTMQNCQIDSLGCRVDSNGKNLINEGREEDEGHGFQRQRP